MTLSVEAWLRQMCDATDMPPQTDDFGVLLAAWAGVVAARQALLDGERPDLAGAIVLDVVRDIIAELELRQNKWRAALAGARRVVGMQRVGVTQVRRYQRAADAADF